MSPGWTDTTTARDKHPIQVVIFSLPIQCLPSMNITGGIYRWRYASNVQLLFYTLTMVIYPEYSRTYTWFPYHSMGVVQLRRAHNSRRPPSSWLTKTVRPTDYSSSRRLCRPVFACLRLLTRRSTKTGHLRACSWHRLHCSWRLVFAYLRWLARMWCPQHQCSEALWNMLERLNPNEGARCSLYIPENKSG